MKASFSALTGVAFSALLAAAALSACSGGGSSNVPSNPAAAQTNGGSANADVPIGSLNLQAPAGTSPVNVTSRTPAGPTVDVHDQATITVSSANSAGAITAVSQHGFAGQLAGGFTSLSAKRSVRDVAVNAPYDLSYHGGPVLGSAVSHNLFINCDTTCRHAVNFDPGQFLDDLGADQFVTLLYQYLNGPGTIDTTPLTGSYTKGQGALVPAAYASPRPGASNPYYGQFPILLSVLSAAGQPGMGGGGFGHIYHVFLPKNVDTCFESPLGSPTTSCYSPDNGATFVFCAYHGSFTSSGVRYLYSVEPYQDVGGCRNAVHNQTLPNSYPGGDAADPAYSTLSHELFETITDPLGNAWWNVFSGGQEIGDICSEFDNFVTVNGKPYVMQSEYSDLHHICISPNLTGQPQTPQQQPFV